MGQSCGSRKARGLAFKANSRLARGARGDAKRIDFDLLYKERGERIGLEVKWVKRKNHNFADDVQKLHLHSRQKGANGYLLIFGPNAAVVDSRPANFFNPWQTGPVVCG